MVAALDEIARRSEVEHPTLGSHNLEMLRQASDQTGADRTEELFPIWLMRSRVEMWHEHYDEAEKALARAESYAIPRGEQWQTVRFWQGVLWLRQAEVANCIARHAPESCIAPLRGAAIHEDKTLAQRAIATFQEALAHSDPAHWVAHASRWLLNIAYMAVGDYPDGVPAAHLLRFDADEEFPHFVNGAARAGIEFVQLAGSVIADDFDGDGWIDVLTSSSDPQGPMHFFRNTGGRFEQIDDEAGLSGLTGGLNLVQADYDNDGDLDALVLRGAWLRAFGRQPNSLLRNDGKGHFTDVTFDAGLADVNYPTQTAAWGDYDADGDLDIYIGNEGGEEDPRQGAFPSQLFRNNGNGTFTDVAEEAGVTNLRFAKGVQWGDFDDDDKPDLFVSNWHAPNRLYRNLGDGTFADVAADVGVQEPEASFTSWFWDYDNDGRLDLFVGGYSLEPEAFAPPDIWRVSASHSGVPDVGALPALYRNEGGRFSDVGPAQGFDRVLLPMGANFGDLDNDGYLDAYLGTGYPGLEALLPNVMYWNRRGQRFADVTTAGGFGHLQKGHGLAFADFDEDGDQDVLEQIGGFVRPDRFATALFVNPGFGNGRIIVHLRGVRSNRFGVGARIRVDVHDGGVARSIYRTVGSGGTFGANPLRQEIGVGKAERVGRIEVHWPTTGESQVFEDLAVGRHYRITEGSDEIEEVPPRQAQAGSGTIHE
ncbi:MAG TPA: CRTAC1 family protein [Candidatus Limnocylindrales bacterium]|nr:CRTAC1 family protein [Candidatus Limnocylindrales bacterium]